MGGVGQAEGTDFAVAPGLLGQPFHGIVTVPALVHILGKSAFGGIAAPAVLHYRNITV